MKYIFIVNPAAGVKNHHEEIETAIKESDLDIDYEIYDTRSPLDATRFVKTYCAEHNEKVRFYACGGDGTLNEVANGAAGYPNVEIGCIPMGSGNDFVKYYGKKEDFLDLKNNFEGTAEPIDLLKVNDVYSINAVHFGFDSVVANTISKIKRKPIIGGRNAYTVGVIYALLFGMKNRCTVTVNGQDLNNGKILLCTLANGSHVGGSYNCAPRSANNDGMMEVCLVKPISFFNFLRLMNSYKIGRHLDDPRFKKYIVYRRTDKVSCISKEKQFHVSVDGEVISTDEFIVESVHNAINFVVPKSLVGKKNKVNTSV